MENKKLKLTFGIGFLVAFIIWFTAPVFAFEGFDIDCIPYWNDGTSVNDYFQFADPLIPDSPFYSPSYGGSQATEIGLYTGFPVPYYADGDHYSVFMNFSISVPASALSNNWLGLYIKPRLSNGFMGTAAGGEYLIVNVGSYNPYGSSGNSNMYTGSFTWQGKYNCSYKILMSVFIDDGVSVGAQSWIYNFACVFDLNLTGGTGLASDELRPFAISAKYYTGYPTSSTTYYGLGLYKEFTCRCTDTSVMGVLEDIQSAVESIDFSGLSDLSTLTTTIENFYDSYVSINSTIVDRLDDIIDDTEPDEDLTRWAEQQSELDSMNDFLHGMESSYFDALNDFTFPEQPNQTAVGNVFNMFFDNSYILTLIVIALSIMMVCCLLW